MRLPTQFILLPLLLITLAPSALCLPNEHVQSDETSLAKGKRVVVPAIVAAGAAASAHKKKSAGEKTTAMSDGGVQLLIGVMVVNGLVGGLLW